MTGVSSTTANGSLRRRLGHRHHRRLERARRRHRHAAAGAQLRRHGELQQRQRHQHADLHLHRRRRPEQPEPLDYTSDLGARPSTAARSSTPWTNPNAANLTLPAPGSAGSLGANKSIVIDTTAPTVTGVTLDHRQRHLRRRLGDHHHRGLERAGGRHRHAAAGAELRRHGQLQQRQRHQHVDLHLHRRRRPEQPQARLHQHHGADASTAARSSTP